MTPLITSFITLQIILLFFITLHDWIHLPPLTDIRALEKNSTVIGRVINSTIFAFFVLVPLYYTWAYAGYYTVGILVTIVCFYGGLTLGTILSWWVPYLFESSDWHKENFKEYESTHHFLPKRGDNVVPNTLHVILHLLIWSCLAIAVYLLVNHLMTP